MVRWSHFPNKFWNLGVKILDGGGMFLEVKIMEIFDPILGFQPNFFFKIHSFVVISHIDGMMLEGRNIHYHIW